MGWSTFFLAANCHKPEPREVTDQHQNQDKEEEVGVPDKERQELKRISLNDLRQSAIAGEFLEIKWTAIIALALLRPEFGVDCHYESSRNSTLMRTNRLLNFRGIGFDLREMNGRCHFTNNHEINDFVTLAALVVFFGKGLGRRRADALPLEDNVLEI
jgi:hypothetical protein